MKAKTPLIVSLAVLLSGSAGIAFTAQDAQPKYSLVSPGDCGHSCRVAVKSKDYIFHPYRRR